MLERHSSQATWMPPITTDFLSTDTTSKLQRSLLRWFGGHCRDLPWRRDRDPYRIWVSEIMLQQTQVATVIRYFERFLESFPTIGDLAEADEQEVFRVWEGLGYYRRAHHLHQAARRIVQNHGGVFPRDPEAVAALPGIGRYSKGAILSQAFGDRLPILEANSQRVLCRLFAQRGDPRKGPTRRWLWRTAEALLPRRQAGEFNQALMELGALICTPTSPRCLACPLRRLCRAARLGLEEIIPIPAKKENLLHVREVSVVIRQHRRVLLLQRPRNGRWAGLWEFLHGQVGDDETYEEAARRQAHNLAGMKIVLESELATLRHSVTHHRITLKCFAARHRGGSFRSAFYLARAWVTPEEISGYAVSSPQRRLAKMLLSP